MDNIERIIDMLDKLLDTKRKRHMVGGILVSASALFCGLAVTIMTMKEEEKEDEGSF